MSTYTVAVVGATGAVGQEILRVLERRDFPVSELRLLASARSVGKTMKFRGEDVPVQELSASAFEGVDFALFSAGATRSKEFAPAAVAAGARVIDNSSAYRMDPAIPLVIPEVNPGDMHDGSPIIANPNCCAAVLAVALWPLAEAAGLERVILSTYQSASGAGAQAMAELDQQTRDIAAGKDVTATVFPHPIAHNLFSHNSAIEANGHNGEENKVVAEIRKIFHLPDLPMSVTCVRVPVPRAHSESVVIETTRPLEPAEARAILERAPGVRVVDDAEHNHFPMPIEASGDLDVLVGRIRQDGAFRNGLAFFLSGDQLLKGAAWNAVQIAETLIAEDTVEDPACPDVVRPIL